MTVTIELNANLSNLNVWEDIKISCPDKVEPKSDGDGCTCTWYGLEEGEAEELEEELGDLGLLM